MDGLSLAACAHGANCGQSLAMRILVVGGGGREHALCWAISASPLCTKLYCAPGNAGIAQVAECVDVAAEDIAGQVALAQREKIDFVVVGPEARWSPAWPTGSPRPASRCSAPRRRPPSSKAPRASPRNSAAATTFRPPPTSASPTPTRPIAYVEGTGRADRGQGRRPRRRQGRGRGRDGRAGDRRGARHAVGQPLRRGRRLGRDRGIHGRRGGELSSP